MRSQDIIIERVFKSPVEKVWKAISDKNEMKKWYFDLPEFKAEVGCKFQFEGGKDPQRPYLHLCEITEVVPFKKLTYSWAYKGYEGLSYVTFELFDEGDSTKLKLTHKELETFPKTNPDLAKENFIEGWTHIIGISLKEFLEKL